MRPGNHVMTGTVTALVTGFTWPEIPLVMVGTCLPSLLEKVCRRYPLRSHAVSLWLITLVVLMAVLPAFHIGGVLVRPWAVIAGGLIHVIFDLLGDEKIPLLPFRERPYISLRLYRTGNVLSEDTFVWLFMAAGIFVWLFKNHG